MRKPPLYYAQMLAWADAHHARTGEWPGNRSGPVLDAPGETWYNINAALQQGSRGLRPGSTLVRLLYERRGVRNAHRPPPLSIEQILRWADEHHRRTGDWPHWDSGVICGAAPETWTAVADAMYVGLRGLPKGSSLAQLLTARRGVRNRSRLPVLTHRGILAWADAQHRRTGAWPTVNSGPIAEAAGETWSGVAAALNAGIRGQPGGSSLAKLLLMHRGVRRNRYRPRLSVAKILTWADAHRRRTGRWPNVHAGRIVGAPGETWHGVDSALRKGLRGLRGVSSLSRLLNERRGVPNVNRPARLSITRILRWADAYHARTGRWPTGNSGVIAGQTRETWARVNGALQQAQRGLRGRSSLAQLLEASRGVRNRMTLARLTERKILTWADRHFARTGRWPRPSSGPVLTAPGETWDNVNVGLHAGTRGLPGGDSLARLLSRERGARNIVHPPPLAIAQILTWMRQHRRRTGEWPHYSSGPIPGTAGETWTIVDGSLQKGRRGLPGGSSLRRLIDTVARSPRRARK